jgi:diguanylate cyclase (GGDEF)-like protein
MPTASDLDLLQELRFQLTVTRAMLGALELDKVLYIMLSGLTHGDGLKFNRAILFLVDDTRRELYASTAVGPASGEEAARIWQEIEKKQLNLDTLLDAYDAASRDPGAQRLARMFDSFRVAVPVSAPPPVDDHLPVPMERLVARCAATREPFHSNTLRVTFRPPGGDPKTFSHFVVVPLTLNDAILGVIIADNAYTAREVDADVLRGITTIGNLAAIAIGKAALHETLKRTAALDGLTGVYNRRHYETRLAEEVARARRTAKPLSLIVFDLDHFKDCNDAYGHECGDLVLKDVSAAIKERVRTEDVVARYGGEEFVVLLTGGLDAHESFEVADKLRRAIEDRAMGGRPAGEITVSGGVATLQAHQVDGGTLFRLADEALYRAKRGGRNRVMEAPAM